MVLAATVCILLALVALVNIEAWRRRTVAELHAVERRRAARERAWQAVTMLEREDGDDDVSLLEREAA